VRAEVAVPEPSRGDEICCRGRGGSARAKRPAVNGVKVGEAVTGTDEEVSLEVIGSLLVIAVVAVVACNACNARIAYNARNARGVWVCATTQRRQQ